MYFYGSIYSCSLDMAVSITHIIKVNLNRTKKWKYYYVEKQKHTLIQQTMKNEKWSYDVTFVLVFGYDLAFLYICGNPLSFLLSKLKPKM